MCPTNPMSVRARCVGFSHFWVKRSAYELFVTAAMHTARVCAPHFAGGSVIGSGFCDAGHGLLYLRMISPVDFSQCSLPNAL